MYDTGTVMDLNADVGEGCSDDAALLNLVTSASIACGGHAGDRLTMTAAVSMARENGVVIGAHVSYPDRENFGRRDMQLSPHQLSAEISRQLVALGAVARACDSPLRYVKAHGALYNRMADDRLIAQVLIDAVRRFDPSLPVLTLPDCPAMQIAQALGVRAVAEAFADRAYTHAGRLVERARPGAVITATDEVTKRAVRLAQAGTVMSIDGRDIPLRARSLCLHGDTPGAVGLARSVRAALQRAGITIRAFA